MAIFLKKILTFPDLWYIIKVRKGQKGDKNENERFNNTGNIKDVK